MFFTSCHRFPYYPATGSGKECDSGDGLGHTLNIPLRAGASDTELLGAWKGQMEPALTAYRPNLLLISAGFDGDWRDSLADMKYTPKGFAELSRQVVTWAERVCHGRIVSVLEGGYHLAALAEGVAVHINALLGEANDELETEL